LVDPQYEDRGQCLDKLQETLQNPKLSRVASGRVWGHVKGLENILVIWEKLSKYFRLDAIDFDCETSVDRPEQVLEIWQKFNILVSKARVYSLKCLCAIAVVKYNLSTSTLPLDLRTYVHEDVYMEHENLQFREAAFSIDGNRVLRLSLHFGAITKSAIAAKVNKFGESIEEAIAECKTKTKFFIRIIISGSPQLLLLTQQETQLHFQFKGETIFFYSANSLGPLLPVSVLSAIMDRSCSAGAEYKIYWEGCDDPHKEKVPKITYRLADIKEGEIGGLLQVDKHDGSLYKGRNYEFIFETPFPLTKEFLSKLLELRIVS